MKVFVYGNQGNMGKRYEAILKYLGHECLGYDLKLAREPRLDKADAIIIATSTTDHLNAIDTHIFDDRPILCEKPFIKEAANFCSLENVIKKARKANLKLSMVSQYDLFNASKEGDLPTLYDYFKSGSDGLAWDCINIIWHSRNKIILKNESPIWTCRLNGWALNIEFMDHAYIEMIENWLRDPYVPQYDRILDSHRKVLDYLDGKFQ